VHGKDENEHKQNLTNLSNRLREHSFYSMISDNDSEERYTGSSDNVLAWSKERFKEGKMLLIQSEIISGMHRMILSGSFEATLIYVTFQGKTSTQIL